MKSTSGRFSALIIFDGTIWFPLSNNDVITTMWYHWSTTALSYPTRILFGRLAGILPGGSHQPLFSRGDYVGIVYTFVGAMRGCLAWGKVLLFDLLKRLDMRSVFRYYV